MAKAGLLLGLSALTAGASAVETRKTRKSTERTTAEAKLDAEAAVQETKDASTAAETAANEKRKKRAAELATGGRAAQFKTGPLGLKNPATVGKKTLLGE